MSKLEQLIQEFCPNGVEYKTLRKLGYFYGGLSGKSKEDFTAGNAKFITYMNVFSNISLKLDVDGTVKVKENEKQNTVLYGDVIFTGSSETPDECGMSSVLTIQTNEKLYLNSFCFGFRFFDSELIIPDFSKYIFRSEELRNQIKKTASGVTRFNVSKKKMENVKIPLPPIAVQSEIVRILDNFMELTEELAAELTARKKQYEYYRDSLLTFEYEVSVVPLGVVADINVGCKPEKIYQERNDYEYINAGTTNSGYFDRYNCLGDTVTTPSRGQGGIGFVGYQKERFWLGALCYKIQANKTGSVITKYLYYYLQSNNDLIFKIKKEGGVPAVNRVDLVKVPVVVPPLPEQQRIVDILDRFDKLCNDISEGLPAEIDARRKQYEFYRDKLLTFKEVSHE